MKEWAKRSGKTRPIAILDGEDVEGLSSHLFNNCKVYFKREYLKGRSYPSKVKPLPFAAIPEQVVDGLEITRKAFYSGHATHPFRGEIDAVLRDLGFPAAPHQEKTAYNKCLMQSLVGVSVRGNGWDTYRFWEIPYFGACLLAQRPGIVIPQEFVDGHEALYYDNVMAFKAKLKALLDNPDKAVKIGEAGRKASLERHLSVHRAKSVLEEIV